MGLVIDDMIGDVLMHSHPLDTVTSDPASGEDGQLILNTTDDTIKVYYGGSWQTLHTLTPAVDYYLLQETGDFLLLESGDKFIQE